ncbi:hypothetical protein E2C01_029626 [Portunus trituberculatus]|uniref:Uncharacterized protein n=1 Tax=Portunus trituberculatus TaxID=210409 RepID=A0A5B7ESE3_PORTR|nr:hypothetical protein [Portunus trituberculatus]
MSCSIPRQPSTSWPASVNHPVFVNRGNISTSYPEHPTHSCTVKLHHSDTRIIKLDYAMKEQSIECTPGDTFHSHTAARQQRE